MVDQIDTLKWPNFSIEWADLLELHWVCLDWNRLINIKWIELWKFDWKTRQVIIYENNWCLNVTVRNDKWPEQKLVVKNWEVFAWSLMDSYDSSNARNIW